MRPFVHVGLTVALVLAPALCCCKARGLGATAHAAHASAPTPTPESVPAIPVESCTKAKSSCCHEPTEAPESVPATPTENQPAQPANPDSCACNTQRPDAAHTETKPVVAAAEPTGELLAVAASVVGSLEHFGLVWRSHPPDWTGVDTRSEALFARHVLRC